MPRVLMLLAYSHANPDGDVTDGFDLSVSLTPQGRLDTEAWRRDPPAWTVRRLRGGVAEHDGALVRAEDSWVIRVGEEEMPLAGQVIRPGEYVTVRGAGGEARIYRIVEVRPG